MKAAAALVVGIGREGAGDDAAGLLVARRVAALRRPGLEAVAWGDDLVALIEAWEGRESVVVVDAMRSGSPPGTILRFDASEGPVPARAATVSTHGLALTEIVEIARVIGRLPLRVVVFGIEGRRFGPSDAMSPEVEAALADAAERAVAEAVASTEPARA